MIEISSLESNSRHEDPREGGLFALPESPMSLQELATRIRLGDTEPSPELADPAYCLG